MTYFPDENRRGSALQSEVQEVHRLVAQIGTWQGKQLSRDFPTLAPVIESLAARIGVGQSLALGTQARLLLQQDLTKISGAVANDPQLAKTLSKIQELSRHLESANKLRVTDVLAQVEEPFNRLVEDGVISFGERAVLYTALLMRAKLLVTPQEAAAWVSEILRGLIDKMKGFSTPHLLASINQDPSLNKPHYTISDLVEMADTICQLYRLCVTERCKQLGEETKKALNSLSEEYSYFHVLRHLHAQIAALHPLLVPATPPDRVNERFFTALESLINDHPWMRRDPELRSSVMKAIALLADNANTKAFAEVDWFVVEYKALQRLQRYFEIKIPTDGFLVSFEDGTKVELPLNVASFLMESSDYFKKLFTGDMIESQKGEIALEQITPEQFQELIAVVVQKEEPKVESLSNLMVLADRFFIPTLFKTCCERLRKEFEPLSSQEAIALLGPLQQNFSQVQMAYWNQWEETRDTIASDILFKARKQTPESRLDEKEMEQILAAIKSYETPKAPWPKRLNMPFSRDNIASLKNYPSSAKLYVDCSYPSYGSRFTLKCFTPLTGLRDLTLRFKQLGNKYVFYTAKPADWADLPPLKKLTIQELSPSEMKDVLPENFSNVEELTIIYGDFYWFEPKCHTRKFAYPAVQTLFREPNPKRVTLKLWNQLEITFDRETKMVDFKIDEERLRGDHEGKLLDNVTEVFTTHIKPLFGEMTAFTHNIPKKEVRA